MANDMWVHEEVALVWSHLSVTVWYARLKEVIGVCSVLGQVAWSRPILM